MQLIEPFKHERNITVGQGRIMYASEKSHPVIAVDDFGEGVRGGLKPGWVLPGGRRTQDSAEAYAAAQWINQQSRHV